MKLFFMGPYARRKKLAALLQEAQVLEAQLCDVIAQVVELTEKGDELHLQMRELLEALEK